MLNNKTLTQELKAEPLFQEGHVMKLKADERHAPRATIRSGYNRS